MLFSPEAAAVDRRILAAPTVAANPARPFTEADLRRHAQNYGADGVLGAAEGAGFGPGERLVLQAWLSRLQMRYGHRAGRRFPIPESVAPKLSRDELPTAAAYRSSRGDPSARQRTSSV